MEIDEESPGADDPMASTINGEPAPMDAAIDTPYDGSGRQIIWPGQETWGPEDGTAGKTDLQIATLTALEHINATDRPNHFQVKDKVQSIMAEYDSLSHDGVDPKAKELVDRQEKVLRESGPDMLNVYRRIWQGK